MDSMHSIRVEEPDESDSESVESEDLLGGFAFRGRRSYRSLVEKAVREYIINDSDEVQRPARLPERHRAASLAALGELQLLRSDEDADAQAIEEELDVLQKSVQQEFGQSSTISYGLHSCSYL
jgi:hypothetical protein